MFIGLIRVIALIVIALILVLAFKRLTSRAAKNKNTSGNPGQETTESMVKCEQCGVHLPQSQAQRTENGWRCEEHTKENNQ